jgi:CBS domain containing-hemolysin-like protein
MLAVRDANRRFNLKLPEEAGYTTVAGFMLAHAGRLLAAGDEVEHAGARFRVERVERRRIRRVRLTSPPAPAHDSGQSTLEALLPFIGTAALGGASALLV